MSDLIDRERFSADMRDFQNRVGIWRDEAEDTETRTRADAALATIIETKLILDKQPTIAASPWHRVEEPPKESGKQYAVWASKGYAYCDKWLGDRWLISSVAPETITHWMPIEPPKEDADADK